MFKVGDNVIISRGPTAEEGRLVGYNETTDDYWPGGNTGDKKRWMQDRYILKVSYVSNDGLRCEVEHPLEGSGWTVLACCLRPAKRKPTIIILNSK